MGKILISEVVEKYDLKPVGRPSGGEQPYECPVGGKHFDINIAKGSWHCFHECTGCSKTGGGAYALWCMLHGIDPDAELKKNFRKFCEEFEGASELHKKATAITEQAIQKIPEESPKAPDEICDKAYSALLDKCKLSRTHRADLLKRGFSDEDIAHFGFKSIPQVGILKICQEILAEGVILDGVPGFYKRGSKWSLLTSGSGYFIPYKNKTGQIVGLQVRYDISLEGLTGDALKDAKRRRYRWVSSPGVTGGASISLVPYLGEPRGGDKAVYVTEGGLKAMAAATISKRWFVAIPGISCYTVYRSLLGYLKECGITTIVDAWDTDRYENESVQNAINKLWNIAEKEYGMKVVMWDAFMNGGEKGVDDFLVSRKNRKKA